MGFSRPGLRGLRLYNRVHIWQWRSVMERSVTADWPFTQYFHHQVNREVSARLKTVTLRRSESKGSKQIHTKCCSNAFKEGEGNCGGTWWGAFHWHHSCLLQMIPTTVPVVMKIPNLYCFIYDNTSSFQYSEIVRRLRQKIKSARNSVGIKSSPCCFNSHCKGEGSLL